MALDDEVLEQTDKGSFSEPTRISYMDNVRQILRFLS